MADEPRIHGSTGAVVSIGNDGATVRGAMAAMVTRSFSPSRLHGGAMAVVVDEGEGPQRLSTASLAIVVGQPLPSTGLRVSSFVFAGG